MEDNKINLYIENICKKVKASEHFISQASTAAKNQALTNISDLLIENIDAIIAANKTDLENANDNGVPLTMLDRLKLDEKRIKGISDSLIEICTLDDPIGKGERTVRPNGLIISRIHVPLGLIAVIYEARPNVTIDAAALCLKSGNAVILRGGKEAIMTNRVLVSIMKRALDDSGINSDVVELVDDTSREGTKILMQMREYIDVLIPRGGAGLINTVVENSKIPIIETGTGNCHIYIDSSADIDMAINVSVNAKMSRPSVCNATESMLVHKDIANLFLPKFAKAVGKKLEIRGCKLTRAILGNIAEANEEDYKTEYNDYIISVKVVENIDEAITHINKYNTKHSEAIITQSLANSVKFKNEVDAAVVYVNASTRFTDGGVFGLGAEIGISTQKLHTRGPVGLNELTTIKYLIDGDGQIR